MKSNKGDFYHQGKKLEIGIESRPVDIWSNQELKRKMNKEKKGGVNRTKWG